MRRVIRQELSARSVRELATKERRANQKLQNGTLNVQVEWNSARQTKPLKEVFAVLQTMAGNRRRCMYCGDSHGTDIEHFWPKSSYPEHMFRWTNMLLCCTDCGRIKGSKFPLADQQPLLIDPSVDNPWDFLDFDPDTGNIVPRYDIHENKYMEKGHKTVEVLEFDRREALAKGCKRAFHHIKQHVEQVMEQQIIDAEALFNKLSDEDDYGLLGWCFDGLGSRVSPFAELQARYPAVWEVCLQAFRSAQNG